MKCYYCDNEAEWYFEHDDKYYCDECKDEIHGLWIRLKKDRRDKDG